jgi:hypothetical protein
MVIPSMYSCMHSRTAVRPGSATNDIGMEYFAVFWGLAAKLRPAPVEMPA